MTGLGTISDELKNEPESLRKSILSSMAKLKGLDLLTGSNAFQRDQSRLDAKQRAIYRLQGLDVKDQEEINNILADNITIVDGSAAKQAAESTTQEKPSVDAQRPNNKKWLPWALATMLTAANIGGGAWIVNNLPKPQQQQPDRMTIGLETE